MPKEYSRPQQVDAKQFSKTVNSTAREQYPQILQMTGEKKLIVPTRLALRRDTQYPYDFAERESLIPENSTDFGGIIHKDREAGLQEIHNTVGTSMKEHSWIYVPDEELWIDGTISPDYTGVVSDNYLVSYLTHLYPVVETVHTHPDILEALAEEDPEFNNWLIKSTRPSGNDLLRHWQINTRANPDAKLQTVVVGHYGYTTTNLSEKGKQTDAYMLGDFEHTINPHNDPIEEATSVVNAVAKRYVDYDDEIPVFDIKFTPMTRRKK